LLDVFNPAGKIPRIQIMKWNLLLRIAVAAIGLCALQGCVGYTQTDQPSSAAPSR